MSEYLWTAFIARDGSNDVLVASSPDGNIWTGSRSINQTGQFAPSLASFNGGLYIAFIANDSSNTILVCSTADGVTWSLAATIKATSDTLAASDCAPSLAAWNGSLYLAYVSNDSSTENAIMVCSTSNGYNWGNPAEVNQTSTSAPSLAAFQPYGETGQLFLAFVGASTPRLFICSFDGTNWSPHSKTNQSCIDSPSLAAFDHNLLHGVYRQQR